MNENERFILGAILIDNKRYDETDLQPEDFQDPDCRRIYQAINRIIEAGQEAGIATVFSEIENISIDFLQELTSAPCLSSEGGFKAWIANIKKESQKRKLDRIPLIIKDYKDDPLKARELIEQELTDLESSETVLIKPLKTVLLNTIERIETAYNNKGQLNGLSTGFTCLDDHLNGLKPGQFVIMGARPSIGKTTLALNMACNIASQGVKVGFFSLEMPADQIGLKIISYDSMIQFNKLERGTLSQDHFNKITEAINQRYLSKMDIVDNEKQLNLINLKTLARRLIRNEAKILFIDHMSFIDNPGPAAKWERVGEISKALKSLARQLKIPIVLLCQLNRDAEGKKPTMADIRNSGEIEEDADIVFFIHRKDRETKDTEIIIEKNRLGQTGSLKMNFNANICRFSEIDTLQPLSDILGNGEKKELKI